MAVWLLAHLACTSFSSRTRSWAQRTSWASVAGRCCRSCCISAAFRSKVPGCGGRHFRAGHARKPGCGAHPECRGKPDDGAGPEGVRRPGNVVGLVVQAGPALGRFRGLHHHRQGFEDQRAQTASAPQHGKQGHHNEPRGHERRPRRCKLGQGLRCRAAPEVPGTRQVPDEVSLAAQGPQGEGGVAVGGQELVADHGRAADDHELAVLCRGVKAPPAPAGAVADGAAGVEEASVRADVTGGLGIGNGASRLEGLLRAGDHPGLPDACCPGRSVWPGAARPPPAGQSLTSSRRSRSGARNPRWS